MDRISNLPENAQHNILNFLEQDEVCRASVLSKAWRSIVHSHPVLCFSQKLLEKNHDNYDYRRKGKRGPVKWLTNGPDSNPSHHCYSSKIIDECLHNKVVVKKFTLLLQYYSRCPDRWNHVLDSWIPHLVQVGVEDLQLDLYYCGTRYDWRRPYVLPPPLFSSKTLTKLWLRESFKVDMKNCSNVNLPNLLDLTLETYHMTDDVFKVFISACPNLLELTLKPSYFNQGMFMEFISATPKLEVLSITVSKELSSICVLRLPRLHSVWLRGKTCSNPPSGFTRVEIIAPNLRIFKTSAHTSNVATTIDLLACESTLKVLWLRCIILTKETFHGIVHKFPRLEELHLRELNLERIQTPKKMIRKLVTSSCFKPRKVDADASSLKILTHEGYNVSSTKNSTCNLKRLNIRDALRQESPKDGSDPTMLKGNTQQDRKETKNQIVANRGWGHFFYGMLEQFWKR